MTPWKADEIGSEKLCITNGETRYGPVHQVVNKSCIRGRQTVDKLWTRDSVPALRERTMRRDDGGFQ